MSKNEWMEHPSSVNASRFGGNMLVRHISLLNRGYHSEFANAFGEHSKPNCWISNFKVTACNFAGCCWVVFGMGGG